MSQAPTSKTFYDDTYLTEIDAGVVSQGKDEKGSYVIVDRTIFHPQGGGQPSDTGCMRCLGKEFDILGLEENKETGVIKHYYSDSAEAFPETTSARLAIDMNLRVHFAKLHTGGHLIANVVEELYPQLTGYRGNHFPGGQSFVIFKGARSLTKASCKRRRIHASLSSWSPIPGFSQTTKARREP